jgi:hypothetical protein
VRVFMEVTRDIENPFRRLNWLNCGYDLVSREGRVFAVRREGNDNQVAGVGLSDACDV